MRNKTKDVVDLFKDYKGKFYVQLKIYIHDIGDLREIICKKKLVLDVGCGEGILTILLKTLSTDAKFVCLDKDLKKINYLRQKHFDIITHNISFEDFESHDRFDLIIFNDVLHHQDDSTINYFLNKARSLLTLDGEILVKEVDRNDKLDHYNTLIWDKIIYPQDKINFKTIEMWNQIFTSNDLQIKKHKRIRNMWPASRTQFLLKAK